jgi:MtaA/CmuA family methyltransferase
VPDGVPRCGAPLEATKDLSALLAPDPLASERMLDRIEAARTFRADVGDRYSILGWVEGPAAEAADLRGVGNFMMDMLDDEAFACELMDRCLDVAVGFARAQIEAGCDTIGIGDAVASQMSPALYDRLIQPREKKLVAAIQAGGGYAKLHICGDITRLLPGIADLGVDILDVDHMVDMAAVRKAVGGNVVITGNLDPAADVLQSTPERIRAAVRCAYAAVGDPYMVNAGCEIPSGTPEENLRALCEPIPHT